MEHPIAASRTVPMDFVAARDVLLDDPDAVFETVERRPGPVKELCVDLRYGASIRQDVTLRLGSPTVTATGVTVPLTWRPTGRNGLLPAFDGALALSAVAAGTNLRLSGSYVVPPGVVAKLGVALLGRPIARRSFTTLIRELASRLESEVGRRRTPPDTAPDARAAAGLDVVDLDHPEIYVG
jgi:hypothetical protein